MQRQSQWLARLSLPIFHTRESVFTTSGIRILALASLILAGLILFQPVVDSRGIAVDSANSGGPNTRPMENASPQVVQNTVTATDSDDLTDRETSSADALLYQRFVEVEGVIAGLCASGNEAQAKSLETQLQSYKNLAARREHLPPDFKGNEVHIVSVRQGNGGIAAPWYGKSIPGEVVVEVRQEENPVVLVLCASQPVNWKITKASSAKIAKVFVIGPSPRTYTGLDEKTPVIDVEQAELYLPHGTPYGGRVHSQFKEIARRDAGGELVTIQSIDKPRRPVIIGPESREWNSQYVLWRMQKYYEKAMSGNQKEIEKSVSNLRFDSSWTELGEFDKTYSIGEFTPEGPDPKSIKDVPDVKVIGAVKVVRKDGSSVWYLLQSTFQASNDWTVIEYDPATGEKKPLLDEHHKISPAWWGYKSITYDPHKQRLVVLGSDQQPFLTYDVVKKEWNRFGEELPRGQELLGVTYCEDDEKFYALGTDILEQPYKLYLYAINSSGSIMSKKLLSEDVYDVQVLHSFCKVQMYSKGRYLIATIINPEQSFYELTEESRPKAIVIESSTGKVLYSKVMKGPPSKTPKGSGEQEGEDQQ